ncbi:MAG TPA: DsbC family protein [Ramlibacter sp.]|uniref:DsbC family protein n=1 Tax=Ramlibacter sp. TaxID=1917967 RepID=UPI002ED12134
MKRRELAVALAATALLAACGKENSAPSGSTGGSPAAGTPVSIEAIEGGAKGFNVGSAMAARVVYVFFDAQCPHCAALWEAAKPLKGQARFVWIPVGLIGEKSVSQGGAILAASDPSATMDQHEASLRAQQGGIAAMNVPDAQKDVVKKNTELFTKFGFGGVPTVVAKHPQSGELVTLEGSMPTAMLAQKLGLSAPS